MIVAMRRSIRVGPRAGSPLEEFGVAPDVLHLMTKRDVLHDNVVQAVGHAGEPQRRARGCGERGVEGSLVEGEPGDFPLGRLREQTTRAFHRREKRRGAIH